MLQLSAPSVGEKGKCSQPTIPLGTLWVFPQQYTNMDFGWLSEVREPLLYSKAHFQVARTLLILSALGFPPVGTL